MTKPTPSISDILDRLTDAQKRALLWLRPITHAAAARVYPGASGVSGSALASLKRLGLADVDYAIGTTDKRWHLTDPRGLAVQSALRSKEPGL